MKLLITESQYSRIISEYYEPEKLYSRQSIIKRLSMAPKYMKEYGKNLPYIDCTDTEGNPHICTRIPEVLYQFLFKNF